MTRLPFGPSPMRDLMDLTMGQLEALGVPVMLTNEQQVEIGPMGEPVYIPPDEELYLTVELPDESDVHDFDDFYSVVQFQVNAWSKHPGITLDLSEAVRVLMAKNGWRVAGTAPLSSPPFSGRAATFTQIN